MHLAELAERRAAEEESARRAAEVREHRLRAQERYVAELQTRVSYPVYFIDHKGDMYNAGEEPREYRKRPPPPPIQEPKKWRWVTMKVHGPADDLAQGEWEYQDKWVLA